MGSSESEKGRGKDEFKHKVEISKYFWISEYEITTSQYIKGGSWNSYMDLCRSASRDRLPPIKSFYDIGFRVILSKKLDKRNIFL